MGIRALRVAIVVAPVLALAVFAAVVLVLGGNQNEVGHVRISGQGCRTDIVGQGYKLSDDVVLTSGHVVDGLAQVLIDGGDGPRDAAVVHIDRVLDVAVLVRSDRADRNAALREALAERADDFVTPEAGGLGALVLRDDDGGAQTVNWSVVRRIRANTENVGQTAEVVRPSLELNAALKHGDSGGVLRNEDGTVAGLIWAVSRNRPEVAYAVQGEALLSSLEAAVSDPSGYGSC